MGFFSFVDGRFGPSEEYLKEHPLEIDNELGHEEYNIEDDNYALTCPRICEECGQTFTLERAMSYFYEKTDADYFYRGNDGTVCGRCAVEIFLDI